MNVALQGNVKIHHLVQSGMETDFKRGISSGIELGSHTAHKAPWSTSPSGPGSGPSDSAFSSKEKLDPLIWVPAGPLLCLPCIRVNECPGSPGVDAAVQLVTIQLMQIAAKFACCPDSHPMNGL